MTLDASTSAKISSEAPWYLKDLLLPLIVTFLTYLGSRYLLKPISKWRELKDEMITLSIQYANYVAYSYVGKDGKRHFEDRGLINKVEQDLRRLAGKICTLSDYSSYNFWRFIRLIPDESKIESIRGDLIGWANSLIEKDFKYNSSRDLRIESLKKDLDLQNNYEQLKEIYDLELKNARRK
jgi:hypothetical protein